METSHIPTKVKVSLKRNNLKKSVSVNTSCRDNFRLLKDKVRKSITKYAYGCNRLEIIVRPVFFGKLSLSIKDVDQYPWK